MGTIENKVFEQLCFDFYGELLSDRQKTVLDYYYNEDYSLSEIGEIIGLTRQGVYDAYRRAKAQMLDYEKKLDLVSRYLEHRSLLTEINSEISDLLENQCVYENLMLQSKIMALKESIDEIIEGY